MPTLSAMKAGKEYSSDQLLVFAYEAQMLSVLRNNLKLREIPQIFKRLVTKIAWYCVKNDSEPEIFERTLSNPSPQKMFAAAGRIMGKELDYDEELEKISETEEKLQMGSAMVKTISKAVFPARVSGPLKGRYNIACTKIGWYCYNNGIDPQDVIENLKRCKDIYDLEKLAESAYTKTPLFVGMSSSQRTKEEQSEIEKGYLEQMKADGVQESIQPLLFKMLVDGRSIYTTVRTYSESAVRAAAYISGMKNPIHVWRAAESLKCNLPGESEYRPELLEFASKMASQYPDYSGENPALPADYFRAASQFYGLTLKEAQGRSFISNRQACIAGHFAKNLSGAGSVTPEILRLSEKALNATKNIPMLHLYLELDLFNGKTVQEASKDFEEIHEQGLKEISSLLSVRYYEYVKFDSDPPERKLQKIILQNVAYKCLKDNISVPEQLLEDNRNTLPETLARKIRQYADENSRHASQPALGMDR